MKEERIMKKFLSLMLAVLMLLSMATVAMADSTNNIDHGNWNITNIANAGSFNLVKVYTNGEYAPDETFSFTITPKTEGDPTPTITATPSNKNGVLSETITVKLPMYTKVGTYEYTMTEKSDTQTKGVVYDTVPRTLMVYVENATISNEDGTTTPGFKCQVALYKGEKKDDRFTNVYNQGTAMITKRVDSTVAADKANRYNFTITLSNVNDVDYTGVVVDANGTAVTGAPNVTIHGMSKATFTLTDGQSLKIEHLPAGASYTVTETKPSVNASHNGTVTVKYDNVEAEYDENGVSTNAATGEIKTDETTTSTIANNFAYKGDLIVKKVVTGNLGDEGKWFSFTVKGLPQNFELGNMDKVRNQGLVEGGDYGFEMQHNGQITFKDLPYGTSYTVTELSDGYNSSKTVEQYFVGDAKDSSATDDGKMDHVKEVVTFTNDNQQNIETGVSLDTLPYVLVLALAGAGLVLMIARKRRVED